MSLNSNFSSELERVRAIREEARQKRFDRAEAAAAKAALSGSPSERRAALTAMADALCFVPADKLRPRRRLKATRGGSGILTGAIKAPVSYVYVIGAYQQSVKVGLSECPEKRLADLQTSNPAKLRLHFKAEVAPDKVRFVEMQAHKALSGKRLAGEWFDCSPDEAEQAIKAIIAAL
jgi:hypothetical protein